MCDTIVALGNSTQNGSVLFAKNSDRDTNEAHEIVIIPGSKHVENSKVRCTYIEVPQVNKTYSVLLAKPFWIWGCEMGANEHGVVIGNEAVFTKAKVRKEPGLIGMDFIRLALERTKSAAEALRCIVDLLENLGQSGNCSFDQSLYYHNSFLIADPKEAWVLETADYQWAAKKVETIYSISNAITIEKEWDLCSDELVKYAVDRHWCKGRDDFNFKLCYSEFLHTHFSQADIRRQCSLNTLGSNGKKINALSMMKALRSHIAQDGWRPDQSLTRWGVCMHQGFGPFRVSQSVGSLVSEISPTMTTHWVTGTSAPCTGFFKPIWLDSGMPATEKSPINVFDPVTMWWKHEELHREVLKDYPERINLFASERDSLESDLYQIINEKKSISMAQRKKITAEAFELADQKRIEWLKMVRQSQVKYKNNWLYQQEWNKINRKAGMSNLI
jgi:secernin